MELFTMPRRKAEDGTAVAWEPATAEPRLSEDDPTYLVRERREVSALREILTRINPKLKSTGGRHAARRLAHQGN
jgi:hypothetical protein